LGGGVVSKKSVLLGVQNYAEKLLKKLSDTQPQHLFQTRSIAFM